VQTRQRSGIVQGAAEKMEAVALNALAPSDRSHFVFLPEPVPDQLLSTRSSGAAAKAVKGILCSDGDGQNWCIAAVWCALKSWCG